MALITNQEKTTMKHSLFLTILAAALLGSGVANAAGTLYASQYGTPDYTKKSIILSNTSTYNTLVVDVPLTMTGVSNYLDLYDGATIAFSKENGAESICGIFTSEANDDENKTVFFNYAGDVYNFTFDADAQAVVAASAGTPITLIEDLNKDCRGFSFYYDGPPSMTTLKLNGAVAGGTVVLGGVSFTYVGPQEDTYTFQEGEIGFTGYYDGSHALKLVVGGKPTPEPTTGTLSLLALAGLCIRRRK